MKGKHKLFLRDQLITYIQEANHLLLFPEEYDFMYDSNADANDRRRGINPMSEEYTNKVNERL